MEKDVEDFSHSVTFFWHSSLDASIVSVRNVNSELTFELKLKRNRLNTCFNILALRKWYSQNSEDYED